MMIALYKPEIPQNSGTLARLAACLNITLVLIEPQFMFSDRRFRRARMDYLNIIEIIDYNIFVSKYKNNRIILLDRNAKTSYLDFQYQETDILMAGSESNGFDFDSAADDYSVKIEMNNSYRSLNLALSVAMVTGEAMRQIDLNK